MKPTPRIAYVLKMYPRFSQTFVVNEILAHEAAGCELDIISMRLPDDARFHESVTRVNSPVTRIPRAPAKAAVLLEQLHSAAVDFPDTWKLVAENPEVIAPDLQQALSLAAVIRERNIRHLHAHFGTIATTTSRLAARLAGVSYSFTAHAKDIYHESVEPEVLRRKLADAAAVITVSDYNLQYLRATYGDAARKVVHIDNGLPLDEFSFRPPGKREALILAVGRLIEKKGFADLIQACGILRDQGLEFRCEIAGEGELRGELAKLINTLGLTGQVHLIGPQPQGEIRRKLHQAAVLAAPCVIAANKDRDGLPTILLEAMAMGTPCVSTDVTGIPEILHDGKTGLAVPQSDPAELAAACKRLIGDQPLRIELAGNARNLVESRFDINKNAAAIRNLVADVLGEPIA
jgi:glycosyltransferase involved in cell wall biosynthesis